MRKYNRRLVQRVTQFDSVRALLPNPLTRVELPPAPRLGALEPRPLPAGTGAQPPGTGNGPIPR